LSLLIGLRPTRTNGRKRLEVKTPTTAGGKLKINLFEDDFQMKKH
jgi:hypothetical protein